MKRKINVYEIRESGRTRAVATTQTIAQSARKFSSAQSARSCGAIASSPHIKAKAAASSRRYNRRDKNLANLPDTTTLPFLETDQRQKVAAVLVARLAVDRRDGGDERLVLLGRQLEDLATGLADVCLRV